jgi:uncharacterized protein
LTHGRARQRLEADQSAWLQHRSSCGRNPSCIARAYKDRVTYLYEHSTPNVCDGPILKQPMAHGRWAPGPWSVGDDAWVNRPIAYVPWES